MSIAKIILNPYAKRWQARQRLPELRTLLRELQVAHELVETSEPGHGIELAAQAVRAGFSPIVAAGGDSTINEVVNGMMQVWEERRAKAAAEPDSPKAETAPGDAAPPIPPLGILPLGTANDLAANLGLPPALRDALLTVIAGNTRLLDVGQCNQRYFVNNSGIGLEPYATYLQASMRGNPRNTTRYLRAALQRLDSLAGNSARERTQSAVVRAYRQRYEEALNKGWSGPQLDEFRWLIEELRVSLFAQTLGTSVKVSPQRLDSAWQQVVASQG